MYQVQAHRGCWPTLDLTAFLAFLTRRLKLRDGELITLVWADDSFIQGLNRDHRGQDRPTNVLSYPSDMDDELGDLIFAVETIAQEAAAQGTPFDQHLKHLILHGSLHLLGYDHENEQEAETMEALEAEILQEIALPNPYA